MIYCQEKKIKFDVLMFMKLNERIKLTRKNANLTQKQLSEKLSIGLATLQRYEKKSDKIPVKIVEKIAKICKSDRIWLLTGEEKKLEILNDVIEIHRDTVTRFKDPVKGLENNERLIAIEGANQELYDKISEYIKTNYDAIKILSKSSKSTNDSIKKKVIKKKTPSKEKT